MSTDKCVQTPRTSSKVLCAPDPSQPHPVCAFWSTSLRPRKCRLPHRGHPALSEKRKRPTSIHPVLPTHEQTLSKKAVIHTFARHHWGREQPGTRKISPLLLLNRPLLLNTPKEIIIYTTLISTPKHIGKSNCELRNIFKS